MFKLLLNYKHEKTVQKVDEKVSKASSRLVQDILFEDLLPLLDVALVVLAFYC